MQLSTMAYACLGLEVAVSLHGDRRGPIKSRSPSYRPPKLEQGFLRVADHEFPGRGIHGIQQIVDEFVLNLEA